MLVRSAQLQSDVLSTDGSKTPPALDYNALGQRIVNVADPINPSDALTLKSLVTPLYTENWYQLDFDSVAGQNGYTLPLGSYFHFGNAAPIGLQTRVFVDSGSGFNELFFGPDYDHIRRSPSTYNVSLATQFATVGDIAFGVWLSGGSVPLGWKIRIEWLERKLLITPPPIAKTRFPIDNTVKWRPGRAYGPPAPGTLNLYSPNAVNVCCPNGYQVEFWRQTFHNGGRRGAANPDVTGNGNIPGLRRMSRRYVPYFRGEVDRSVFKVSYGAASQAPLIDFPNYQGKQKRRYKVCYYDPNTGARSALSTETIVVANERLIGDRNKGSGLFNPVFDVPHIRAPQSVWLED